MSKQLTLTITVVLAMGACTGSVRSPEETVATFSLYADHLEALLVRECVDQYGVEGCTPYPNGLECKTMDIFVKADGRTFFECLDNEDILHEGFGTVGEGVPFICTATDDLACQSCLDVYGNVVLDNCSRNTQLFRRRGTGWRVGDDAAYLEEGTRMDLPSQDNEEDMIAPPSQLPPGQQGACLPSNAISLYAHELNKLTAREGYPITWTPDLEKFGDPNKGVFDGNQTCDQFTAQKKSKFHQCADVRNGQCYYCYKTMLGFGSEACRCTRIGVAAMKAACQAIPPECDRKAWSTAMIKAYGISLQWLFSPSYESFYGKVDTSGKFPKCKGSPLVLDLSGDGIQPTSPENGVSFDLMSTGPLQTSWVGGDDALVALDRNGNGRIDNGAELFGEVTGGVPRENGFGALADLDSNKNGRIDPADRMYDRVLLWQDHDGDGISHANELLPLAGAGIQSLDLSSQIVPDAVDPFGNDLRMQGSFTRTDGSTGLMVDVLFVAGSR